MPDTPHLYFIKTAVAIPNPTIIGWNALQSPPPRSGKSAFSCLKKTPKTPLAFGNSSIPKVGWSTLSRTLTCSSRSFANGEWALVVANIAVIGIDTPGLHHLTGNRRRTREEGGRIRVLYILPEMTGSRFVKTLEQARLPYVTRPFHFHDFLEKVSDLLFEVNAIAAPLRQVSYEFGGVRKKKQEAKRASTMFASRSDYSYSEEEVAEYEKQESAAGKRHKPRTNLGDPNK